ncbi:NUDIX domain-containing protein [Candidatus Peribacteria bacterium]|nr:NUDIX domain-containing protein [Candidatus Peribacteria bacterium]
MADELLDVVDEQGTVIGTAMKSECHRNPALIHPVVHCWVFNSAGQVLLQQCSLQKQLAPGMWDVSGGGHVGSGEHPDDAILRELEEELGVTGVRPIWVTKQLFRYPTQTELTYVYFLLLDRPAESFSLEEDEVSAVRWYDIQTLVEAVHSGEIQSTSFYRTHLQATLQHIAAQYFQLTHS